MLDGLVGGLDISTLGTSFDVPRLDGSGNIRMTFTPSFTSLSATSTRVLFGLGTRLSAPAAHARPSLGAPVPTGAVLLDPSGATPAAVGVDVGLLDQAVHALWRAGFFDVALDAGSVSGLPAGLRATLRTQLPPAVALTSDGRVELSLGAVGLLLDYPGLFRDPLAASLGARASMQVTLVGDELHFSDFRLDELHLSTDAVSLDTSTRTTLEGLLGRILEHVIGSALGEALPAIPIPAFEIPASLGTYGLPVGASLGIVSPSLSTTGNHFVLSGGFGIR